MAAGGRRQRAEEHENQERWLLTYSDMITLLLALFIVLFSISAVNVSKFQTLQASLKSAFSASILSGGRSILQTGASSSSSHTPQQAEVPALVPITPVIPKPDDQGAGAKITQAQQNALVREAQNSSSEQSDFTQLQHRINSYAHAHGWSNQVRAQIERRGLVVTVLTGKLLFGSGSATLQTAGAPLLDEMSTLINLDPQHHPVVVEGYTDDVPIDTAEFPSNWQLSAMRATNVAQYLQGHGVAEHRLSAAGYADQFPVSSNATDAGRARNRRVEIVFERKYPEPNPGT